MAFKRSWVRIPLSPFTNFYFMRALKNFHFCGSFLFHRNIGNLKIFPDFFLRLPMPFYKFSYAIISSKSSQIPGLIVLPNRTKEGSQAYHPIFSLDVETISTI